ncbi:MAG: hypothetical protein ACKVKG_03030 [Alphaproteobacteria bacterium]|jgi:hypothetical protein
MARKGTVIKFSDHAEETVKRQRRATPDQLLWLSSGVRQPGGKLPLFDPIGQRVDERMIQSCLDQGWAEPWFNNPIKPDWLVCKLTEDGRALVNEAQNGAA